MPKNRKKFRSNPDFVEQAKAEFGVKPSGAEADTMYRSRRQMDTEKPAAFFHNLGFIQDYLNSNPGVKDFLAHNSTAIPPEVHDQVIDQILATIAEQEADKMYRKDASDPQPVFRMGLDTLDRSSLFAAVVTEYSAMQNAYLENAPKIQQISAAQTANFKLDAKTRTQITNEAITDFLLTPKKYQTPEASVRIAVASELIIPAIEKARQYAAPNNQSGDANKAFRTETKKLLHIKKGLPAILKEYKNLINPEDRELLTKPPTVTKKIIEKVAPVSAKPAREPAAPHDNTSIMARIDAGLEEGQHMLRSMDKWNKELPTATPVQQATIRENVARVTSDLKELRETMGRITTSKNSGFSLEEKAKASAVYHQFMSVTTSVKEMTGTINDNLAKLAQGGKVAPTIQVSSAELLANPRALADKLRAMAEANAKFSHQAPVTKPEAPKIPAQPVQEEKIQLSEPVTPTVKREIEAKHLTPDRPPVIPPRPKGPIQVRSKETSEPAPQVEEPKGKVTVTHLQDIRTQFQPEEKKPAPPPVSPTIAAAAAETPAAAPVTPTVTAAPETLAAPPEKKIVVDADTVIPRVHDENILEKGEVKRRIAALNAEAAAKKSADAAEVKPQENQPSAADIIAQARQAVVDPVPVQRTPNQRVRLDALETKGPTAQKPLPSIDGAQRRGRLGPLSMPEKPAVIKAETAAPITPPPEIIEPAAVTQPAVEAATPTPVTPIVEAQAIKADETQPEITPAEPIAEAKAQEIKDETQAEITPAEPIAEVKAQEIKADEIQPETITPARQQPITYSDISKKLNDISASLDKFLNGMNAETENRNTHAQTISKPPIEISTGSAIENTPHAITLAPEVPLQTATAHETETPTPTVASVTDEPPAIEISTGFSPASETFQGKISDPSSTATLHETPTPSQSTLGDASTEPKPESLKEGRVAAAVRAIEEGLAKEKLARDLESAGVLPSIDPSKPRNSISTGALQSVSELIKKNEAEQAAAYKGETPIQPTIVTGANESVSDLINKHDEAQQAAEHHASPAQPSIVTGASESVSNLTRKHNEAQQAAAQTGVSTTKPSIELNLPLGEIKKRGQLFENKPQNVTVTPNLGHTPSVSQFDASVEAQAQGKLRNLGDAKETQVFNNTEKPEPAAVTYDDEDKKINPEADTPAIPAIVPYITHPALSDADAQQENIVAYLAEVHNLDELITELNKYITDNLDAVHQEENIVQMIANHTAYKGDLQILTARLPQVALENPKAIFADDSVAARLNRMGTDLDTMIANINTLQKATPSQNVEPPLIPVNPIPINGAPVLPTLPTPAPPYIPPAQPQASHSNILLRKLPPPSTTITGNPYQNTKNISTVVDKLTSTGDVQRAKKLMDYLSTKLAEASDPGEANLVIRQKLVNEWNNKLYPLLEKINTRMTNLRDAGDMLPPKDRGKLTAVSNAYHEYAKMYDTLYASGGIRDTLQTTLDTHGMESVRVKADELIKIDRKQGESESQFQSRITAECDKLFQPQTPTPQFSVSSANLDMNLITQAAIAVIKGDPSDAKRKPLHSSYSNNTYYSIETGATHTTNCEIKMKKIRDDLDYPRVLADIAMQHGFAKYLPLTQPVSRDQVKDFFTGFKENPPTKDGLNQFLKEQVKDGKCTIKTGRFGDSAEMAEIVSARYIMEVRDSKNKDVCSQKTMAIALDMIQNFSNISGAKEKVTIAGGVNMEEIKRASKLVCEVMKADLKDPAQKWRFDYKTFPRETKPEKFSSSAISRAREILKDIDPKFMQRLQLMDIGVSKVEKNREVEKVTGKFAVAHSDAGIKSDSEETTYQPRRPR